MSDTLHLTHEALSHMLGATRPNVTAAANKLKEAGLIDYRRGNIQIIDGATDAITTIAAGLFENEFAVDELRNKIYIANQTGNQLVIVDGQTNAVTTVPGGGTYLWRIAVNPLTNEIYSANIIGQNATIFAGPPASLPVLLLESVQPKLN